MSSEMDEICELLSGQVRELVKLVNETGITELRIERGELKLYISRTPSADQQQEVVVEQGAASESPRPVAYVVSPLVGRFYRAEPGNEALVECGCSLAKGQKVCVVESMKMLHEVESEFDGQIDEILCENGQAVEYGQPLFRVQVSPPNPPLSKAEHPFPTAG